jgi:hypothetical protein
VKRLASEISVKFEPWVKTNQPNPDINFTCDPNEKVSATFDERASQSGD